MFEDFTLKHLLLFEICAREICGKFVYKHSETIEMSKISLLFKKFKNFTGKSLENSLGLRMQNFLAIAFIMEI